MAAAAACPSGAQRRALRAALPRPGDGPHLDLGFGAQYEGIFAPCRRIHRPSNVVADIHAPDRERRKRRAHQSK